MIKNLNYTCKYNHFINKMIKNRTFVTTMNDNFMRKAIIINLFIIGSWMANSQDYLQQTKTSSLDGKYRKDVLGVDIGIGARKAYEWGAFLDMGVRGTHNFSPYVGWDVVNCKFQGYLKSDFVKSGLFQAMTGLRGTTPDFTKNMKGYCSLRAGYGWQGYLESSGFAYELETGIQLTQRFSVGFAYNVQSLQGKNYGYAGIRLGINL